MPQLALLPEALAAGGAAEGAAGAAAGAAGAAEGAAAGAAEGGGALGRVSSMARKFPSSPTGGGGGESRSQNFSMGTSAPNSEGMFNAYRPGG